ncbi:MAG TPA: adenylate/guanylate cyclase domain-containing protein [Solirubrobacterales bacterium]|jgi:adenylate cyclase|nr:adenylate/guanylate cyclase domain-containing protein [Solirubrobacterales bacterium]
MESAVHTGREVIRRTIPRFAIGSIGANLVGVLIVFVAVAWLIPVPDLPNSNEVRKVNLIALAGYLALAIPVGTFWTLRELRPVRDWLATGRAPTPEEQLHTLRAPFWAMKVQAILWFIGGCVFVAITLGYSDRLALVVGIAVAIGGLSTCTFSYLVTERVTRDIARLALESGALERPAVPGITARVLLTWALATGTPLVAIALIGGGTVLEILPERGNKLAVSAMFLSVVAQVVGLLAMTLVARSVADPVESVRSALARVREGDLDASVPVFDGSEVGLLQTGFNNMVAGLRERERMRDLFGRHVGEDVVEQALAHGVELGGEVRNVGVLFVDLVGSTALAESRPPEEVVRLLNEFFGVVVSTVRAHGGSVNKFEGDAALCIFGAPGDCEDAAGDALAAGLELAKRLSEEVPQLSAGIGISAGETVAGNIGAAERFEYTVIGDPVNVAARLTEIAKQSSPHVVASGEAIARARDTEASRWKLGETVSLRGRDKPTTLATPALD